MFNKHQTGLSMVELMIALALSSFLILGITQIYLDNKRSYQFQQGQSANLDNTRFSTLVLDEVLSRAGYRRAPDQPMLNAFPAGNGLSAHCANFDNEGVITKLSDDSETGFCIRFQPALAGELLCDGSTTVLNESKPFMYPKLDETIYLAIKFVPGVTLEEGSVQCISNLGGSGGELMTGVADMQVEFGSGKPDEKRLKEGSPYQNARDWSAGDGTVRAVRYAMLSANRQGRRDGDSAVLANWLDKHASSTSAARLNSGDNQHIYQAALGGQAVRNMMP